MTGHAFLLHMIYGLIIFILSACMTYGMIRVNIIDIPNHRSMHKTPTPRSGGVAVVLAFLAGMITVYCVSTVIRIQEQQLLSMLVAPAFLAVVALIDDWKGMRARYKLAAQVVFAGMIIASGLVVSDISLPFLGVFHLSPVQSALLTMGWIVFFTNCFNFMDGLNGLASGVTMAGAAALACLAFWFNDHFVYVASITLIAAMAGFFIFNFPHGKIFMGDIGSQFTGGILAVFAVIAGHYDLGKLSLLAVPLLFANFIFDVAFTLIRRVVRKENLAHAHRGHLYQLLQRTGMSHQRVLAVHLLFVILQSMIVFWLQLAPELGWGVVTIVLLVQLVYLAWVYQRAKSTGLVDGGVFFHVRS